MFTEEHKKIIKEELEEMLEDWKADGSLKDITSSDISKTVDIIEEYINSQTIRLFHNLIENIWFDDLIKCKSAQDLCGYGGAY